MIKIFGEKYYVYYLLSDDEILAFTFHKNELLCKYYLNKIIKFHNLQGKIIKDNELDKKLEKTIEKVIYENFQPKVILDDYKFYEIYKILLNTKKGETITYSELMKKTKKTLFEVIQAIKHNPFPIIIPCHRVVRSDGNIIECSPLGKELREKLLRFEKQHI